MRMQIASAHKHFASRWIIDSFIQIVFEALTGGVEEKREN